MTETFQSEVSEGQLVFNIEDLSTERPKAVFKYHDYLKDLIKEFILSNDIKVIEKENQLKVINHDLTEVVLKEDDQVIIEKRSSGKYIYCT